MYQENSCEVIKPRIDPDNLGLQMYINQETIRAGRLLVRELQAQDPVDLERIGQIRIEVNAARSAVKGLAGRIKQAKLAALKPQRTWLR